MWKSQELRQDRRGSLPRDLYGDNLSTARTASGMAVRHHTQDKRLLSYIER